MRTLELTEAAKPLVEYARSSGDEPLILTTDAKPVAALVLLDNVDEESLALSGNAKFLRIVQAAREEAGRGAVVSLEEMKREML